MTQRVDIAFTAEGGVTLRGWLYLPEGPGPHPAITMGHGYACVKEHRLKRFAEAFAADGFVVLLHGDTVEWDGHAAGEVASAAVIEALRSYDAEVAPEVMLTVLGRAVAEANGEVARRADGDPARQGMGSTLTAMLFSGDRAALAHIGQDNDLVFCRADGSPWPPDYVSRRFKRLAVGAGVPVVKLHEGGRHTGNSLMYDAEIRQDIVTCQVGHASEEISQRYNHPLRQAHLQAAEQVARLVGEAGS